MCSLEGLLEQYPALEYPFKHTCYILICVKTATGEVTVEQEKIYLDHNKIIILKPNTINSIKINFNASGYLLCFSEEFFSLRYNHNILHNFNCLRHNAYPFVRIKETNSQKWHAMLDFLFDEYAMQQSIAKPVVHALRSYLNILLFEIEKNLNESLQGFNKHRRNTTIEHFENLVETHHRLKRFPSFYADELHISPTYLNKLCKEQLGQTAGEFIRKRITLEAKRQLQYTNLSVKEIADLLGFESTSYFVTFFKKMTNKTPDVFRKQLV